MADFQEGGVDAAAKSEWLVQRDGFEKLKDVLRFRQRVKWNIGMGTS